MQFTTGLVTLILAASGVHALPATPVEERQATPTIYAQFFLGGGCQGDFRDDTVFVQNTNGCIPNTVTNSYQSTFFSGNQATRTLRVYSEPGCNDAGNYFDLPAGKNGCRAQNVGSARFL